MRKTLLGGLIAAAVLFGGTSSASAANCTFGGALTSLSAGDLYYAATISNCTDVEAVRWVYHPAGYDNTGWWDYSLGGPAMGMNGGYAPPVLNGQYADYTVNNACVGVCVRYVQQACWWYGAPRTIAGRWYAQIKRAATHTWGSVFIIANPSNVIYC